MKTHYEIKHWPSGWARGPFRDLSKAQEQAKKLLAEKGGGFVEIIEVVTVVTRTIVEEVR